jgi:ABC-type transport system involved in cytochrome c biogenesis permease component
MELTREEVVAIKAAVESRNKSKLLQPILFIILVAALLTMLLGSLSADEFTYLATPLVLITIMFPRLSGSSAYNNLVDILEKKLPKNGGLFRRY